MLLGSSSSSSSSSSALPSGIPLKTLYSILRVAPAFIDFRKLNIFILTAATSVNALKGLLQHEEFLGNDEDIKTVTEVIEKHHSEKSNFVKRKAKLEQLRDSIQEKDLTRERELKKEIVDQIEKMDENISPIADYEWAVLCKVAMQSGNVLNDLAQVQKAKYIFLDELKAVNEVLSSDVFKKGSAFLEIKGSYFQELLLKFIGQLCVLKQFESAAVIHQYIHLTYRVLRERESNDTNESKVAFAFAPGLFGGLGLFGHILPRTNSDVSNSRADVQEYGFLKLVMKEMMLHPVFTVDFNPTLYSAFFQNEGGAELSVSYDSPDESSKEPKSTKSSKPTLMSLFRRLNVSSTSIPKNVITPGNRPIELAPPLPPSPRSIVPGYALLHQISMTEASSHSTDETLIKRNDTPRP
jgi:hypothetical protein